MACLSLKISVLSFQFITGCQDNKDIVFILDSSASVGPINFEEMLKYVSVIIKDLTAYGQDHRFSLITYSTDVKTIFSFNRYNTIEQILEAVQTTTYIAGSTNTASGLREAIQLFTSPGESSVQFIKYELKKKFPDSLPVIVSQNTVLIAMSKCTKSVVFMLFFACKM